MRSVARFALLTLLLPLALWGEYLVNDHLLSPKASAYIEKMGDELSKKCGINAYLIATNDKISRGKSLYGYIEKYESGMRRPYVAIVFAPNSMRIGIVASSKEMKSLYDPEKVKGYAIDILSAEDKNSLQSRYDVAMVQAYSELADEVAGSKSVKLETTIKDEGGWFLDIVKWLVYTGSILVFWVYFGRPIYRRLKDGRK